MDILTNLFNLTEPQVIFVVLLSLLMPLSIFVGRRNVRVRRLQLIDNLGRLLEYLPANGRGFIPPALALVRSRYADGPAASGAGGRVLAWLREVGLYLLPTGVFVLLSACGFALVVGLGGNWLEAAGHLLRGLRAEDGSELDFATASALVLGAGFVGAYIW